MLALICGGSHIRVTAPLYKPNTDNDAPFMPWNDNAKPGPWGSPPPSEPPPARGPRRPIPSPPEDNRVRWSDRFGGWYRGPNGKPRLAAIATLVAGGVGLWLLTGLYIVETGQQAVVTTFGAYDRVAAPGLHYHLPWPIEQVETAPTSAQHTDVGGTNPETENESLMPTGDASLANVSFSVIWRVSDAPAYLFNLDDVEGTIKAVGESAMREAVAHTAFQSLVSTGRAQVQTETAARMQQILDSYRAGIHVDAVQIGNVGAPRETADAFRELESARQNAGASADAARTEAARIVQEATANKARTVQQAQAEATAFAPVYEEYKAAPAVTRERLYIETIKRLLNRANKVVVTGKDATVTLPANPTKVTPAPAAGGGQ